MNDKCERGLLGVLREVTPLDYVQRIAQVIQHTLIGDCTVFRCGDELVMMMPCATGYNFTLWHSGEDAPRIAFNGYYASEALDAWLVRVGYARVLSSPSYGDFGVGARSWLCGNVCAE